MPTVPTFLAAQVRAAEAPLLAEGVPLMRRAAHALAQVIAEHHPKRMLVLVGAGDNGGDALYAAAELEGVEVDVIRTSDRVHEAAIAAAIDAGARVIDSVEPDGYDLVVDGILGIGARGALRGRAREIVSTLLPSRPQVIAVDVPSGLDPDTGKVDDLVLPADTTVTFGAVKHGLTTGAGPRLAGRVILVGLGLTLDAPAGRAAIEEVRQG
ncbi:MAG: NAD(P)H-hydrate epimerase [Microbacterium sp.]